MAPPTPRSYRELYSDMANNPPLERTAGYLAGYRFTDVNGAGVPTPANLRDQTTTLSDRQPMAFLALVTGQDGAYEVVVVHRMLRYMDAPGDDPTGLHDRVLGLMGDILPHQYPTIEVTGTAFHLVGNAVRVPTLGAMTALLPTWGEATPVLGPFTEEDPATEVVRPRHIQLVPGRYASLIVHRRRVRPKAAYQEIVGAITAHHEVDACQDILTWLRAACTARGGGGAQNAVPSVHHTFAPLHLPPEAYRYVTSKVHSDLPALREHELGGGMGGAAAFAGALRTLGLAREAGRGNGDAGDGARAKEPRTIVEAYKETYQTLLRYCNVEEPGHVAPVWPRLANCHKSEQHTVLSQELQKVCMARGLSTELYAPIITTTLKQMVISFQFVGHGPDDLSSGCQPFMVAYAGSVHHYTALAAASVGNQLSQGEQSASLTDYRAIRDKEKVKFPRDMSEVCITLTRYAVLCQCLFQGVGPAHPFVSAMWAAATGAQNIAPFVTERLNMLAQQPATPQLYHARIIRAIQLSVHEYMQHVAANIVLGVAGVEVPGVAAMYQDLKRGTFHHSTNWVEIPAPYLEPVPVSRVSVTTQQATTPTVSTAATTATGVSSLTHSTPMEARTSVSRVDNPNRDTEFTSIPIRPGGVTQCPPCTSPTLQ